MDCIQLECNEAHLCSCPCRNGTDFDRAGRYVYVLIAGFCTAQLRVANIWNKLPCDVMDTKGIGSSKKILGVKFKIKLNFELGCS